MCGDNSDEDLISKQDPSRFSPVDYSEPGDDLILEKISGTGMCDAHCHPTTYRLQELEKIGSMVTNLLVCMSTMLEDMELVEKLAKEQPDRVVPAYGLHPWFVHRFYFGEEKADKQTHYKQVLIPEPTNEYIEQLPDLIHISVLENALRARLEANPNAIVGECGLDKTFRTPDKVAKKLSKHTVLMDHQVLVLRAQLDIAAEYKRPVSLHGVRCPQVLFDTIKSYGKRLTRICLHSFSASPKFLEQNWYKQKTQTDRPDLPIVYVSISHLINNSSSNIPLKDLIMAIPPDRLLLESDYGTAGAGMDQLNVRILQSAADASEESVQDMAIMSKRNLNSFLGRSSTL